MASKQVGMKLKQFFILSKNSGGMFRYAGAIAISLLKLTDCNGKHNVRTPVLPAHTTEYHL